MTDRPDPAKVRADLFAEVLDVVQQESRVVLKREEMARARGQATDPDQMRKGAFLAAAAAMIEVLQSDRPYATDNAVKAAMGVMRAINQEHHRGIAA